MARPLKDGLFYFPMDTGFFSDRKIRNLRIHFGSKGIVLYVYILCMVYSDGGYYAVVDDDFFELVEDDTGIQDGLAREIMSYLCKCGLVDGRVLASADVLTSVSIQKRFQEAKRGAKRDFVVSPNYWLLDREQTYSFIKCAEESDFSEKNIGFSEKNGSKSEKNTIKEKENKIKENKRKNSSSDAALAAVVESYESNIGMVTPIIAERLDDWLKDVDISLIIYAIEEAAKNNKHSYSYIHAILNSHFNEGRKTRMDVENANAEREQAKGGNQNGSAKQTGSNGYDFSGFGTIL